MHLIGLFFLLLLHPGEEVKKDEVKAPIVAADRTRSLFDDCGLSGLLSYDAFKKCMEGYERFKPAKHIVAICDFSKTSDQKRFVVVDLDQKKVLSHTYVAHGKNSGDLKATSFSNEPESHKSSLGFFKVGSVIQTTLHGPSLLLDGLEKGKNDNARMREIIIHGAWYACESFIKQYGYCGKSFGCPALPAEALKTLMPVLANGSLLYIYAK
jgi:hypothetical protein